jgi:hypothetical protein
VSLASHWACDLALADIPLPAYVPEVAPYVEPVDPVTVAQIRSDLHVARRDARMRERCEDLRRVVERVASRVGR